MIFGNNSMLASIKSKMKWLNARQVVLAENIAHSNIPNYKPQDLKEIKIGDSNFENQLNRSMVKIARTKPGHISVNTPDIGNFDKHEKGSWETEPSGNSVVLEEELLKVNKNRLDYRTATSMYTKTLKMIGLALGNKG